MRYELSVGQLNVCMGVLGEAIAKLYLWDHRKGRWNQIERSDRAGADFKCYSLTRNRFGVFIVDREKQVVYVEVKARWIGDGRQTLGERERIHMENADADMILWMNLKDVMSGVVDVEEQWITTEEERRRKEERAR